MSYVTHEDAVSWEIKNHKEILERLGIHFYKLFLITFL